MMLYLDPDQRSGPGRRAGPPFDKGPVRRAEAYFRCAAEFATQ
jgi:hypothetical protein